MVCTVTGHGLKDPNRAIAEVQVGDAVDVCRERRASRAWGWREHRVLVTGASAGSAAPSCARSRAATTSHSWRATAPVCTRSPRAAGQPPGLAEALPSDLLRHRVGLDVVALRLLDVDAPVDLLVNNAGFGTFGHFSENDVDREVQEVELDVVAAMRLTHVALGAMEQRGRGAIVVNMSSCGLPAGLNSATYAATKAFVNSFTHAVHEEARARACT